MCAASRYVITRLQSRKEHSTACVVVVMSGPSCTTNWPSQQNVNKEADGAEWLQGICFEAFVRA